MGLRSVLDDLAPQFEKGGKLQSLYPLYEAIDTALYTPGKTTAGGSHVRDHLNLKRVMITVWLCAFIPVFVGSYFVGLNANEAMQSMGQTSLDDWRGIFINGLVSYDPNMFGIVWFTAWPTSFRLYIVVFVAGILAELWFASKRGHEINEGYFVTSILFTLTLPPSIPLWMAAVGVVFGVVVAKEVFGGTGKNFLNPALTGRAFLYFAYPAQMSGDAVWVAVDGYTKATPLGNAAIGEPYGVDWMQAFLGIMPGSLGETSTLAILIAGVLLCATRIASWRVMAGVFVGMAVTASVFNMIPSSNPMFDMPFYWHLVLGGFAFGAIFMATDPVSAAMTDTGRWYYGMLIGFMCVLIRVVNPAFPEGMMLAILFGNLFAPLMDHFVVQSNIKRRLARG